MIGLALFAAGLSVSLGLFLYTKVLEKQEQALQPVADEYQRLQAEQQQLSQSNKSLAKANQAFADAILAIPSAALLLGDLADLIPLAVQLTLVKLEGRQLQLEGVAAEPMALRTVTAFQLSLERSPLFQPQQVQLIKLISSPQVKAPDGQQAQGLTFEMKAALEPAANKNNLLRLEALGAAGLRRRLAVLQEEGLLQ